MSELFVHVSYEYGFIEVEWIYPGTLHELFTDYAEGRVPFATMHEARGRVNREPSRAMRGYNVLMHVHEADDSDLRYGVWEINPEWPAEQTMFVSKFTLEGFPGRVRFDAVDALALLALET